MSESAAPAPPIEPKAAPRLPPAVEEARRPVCSYETKAGDVSAIDLFIPGSDTRWATVLEGAIHTALPRSDEGHPVLAIETAGARVRTEGRIDAIPFELTRPKVFGGIVVPTADSFRVISVTASGLVLAARGPKTFTTTAPLHEPVGCGEVVVGRTNWRASAVLPDTSTAKRALLVTGIAIPLRATEDGATAGELSFPKKRVSEIGGWHSVSVVATSKSLSRVVYVDTWGTVFGWVPLSALQPIPLPKSSKSARQAALREAAEFGVLGLLTGGGPIEPEAPPPPRDRVTCKHDVPLIVEVGAQQVTVGALLAGVPMEVGVGRGVTARLFSSPPGLNPMEAARLFVPTPALEGCSRAPAVSQPGPPASED